MFCCCCCLVHSIPVSISVCLSLCVMCLYHLVFFFAFPATHQKTFCTFMVLLHNCLTLFYYIVALLLFSSSFCLVCVCVWPRFMLSSSYNVLIPIYSLRFDVCLILICSVVRLLLLLLDLCKCICTKWVLCCISINNNSSCIRNQANTTSNWIEIKTRQYTYRAMPYVSLICVFSFRYAVYIYIYTYIYVVINAAWCIIECWCCGVDCLLLQTLLMMLMLMMIIVKCNNQ